jgi:transposase InsO family protein
VVIKAANEFKDKTTAINQLWQSDFTYFKITRWGWYCLSTVLDDFSGYIVAWKLCPSMCAFDVTETLDLAWPRALIAPPSCTGQDFSRTMAHLTWLAIWPSGLRTRECCMCVRRRITLKPKAR